MSGNDAPELIHLVCGSTGAGKTTYSRKLAGAIGGLVFSIDEWMVALFGPDAPDTLSPAWITPRVERCEKQMWSTAMQSANLGVPCILDFGFQRFEHRNKYGSLVGAAGLTSKLHVLDVEAGERWGRIQRRNKEQGDTYHMTITRGMFEYVETIWEPPGVDEIRSFSG